MAIALPSELTIRICSFRRSWDDRLISNRFLSLSFHFIPLDPFLFLFYSLHSTRQTINRITEAVARPIHLYHGLNMLLHHPPIFITYQNIHKIANKRLIPGKEKIAFNERGKNLLRRKRDQEMSNNMFWWVEINSSQLSLVAWGILSSGIRNTTQSAQQSNWTVVMFSDVTRTRQDSPPHKERRNNYTFNYNSIDTTFPFVSKKKFSEFFEHVSTNVLTPCEEIWKKHRSRENVLG